MNFDTSKELFDQAVKVMPGGVNSPVRAYGSVGRTPLFIDHAKGSKIYDVDGNEFIDYVCSYGPGILGHAREEVIEAVQKAAVDGLTFGAPTRRETIIAEMIKEMMPSMEVTRLVSSGTEAVMSAIRTARGFTGRDKIIKFKGCYHGHSDGLLVKAGSAALTSSVPDSAGVPEGYTKTTLVALYNNEDSVRELFEENKDEIAALVVEPVAANMGVVPPKPGFLRFLRDITAENGTVLIFDEVITGFRLSLGGAQQYYGIKPDMTTLGKIVGGGMPMAAYGGRKEIMDHVSPVGKVYQAGTLSGNPVATAAGIKTLEILRDDPAIYDRIDASAKKIADALRKQGEKSGQPIWVNQVGSLLCAYFTKDPVVDYDGATSSNMQAFSDYFGYALEHGVYLAPSQYEAMFVSDAHTEEDIRKTCDVLMHACK
ncbi:MAG: glutamate-1-semialdehyde 2,1-aminomutase [Candidatus Fimousia sp.]|uniref:glutamate-1-semialdehyde 2,1-aminomutase n=1 Tax=Anaerostipes sp. 992a TaxID=1261637 RepID=UPI000951937A|nr:glutamate-1-semialdehyde 2,1-aminomutase [Anaerostipes sp. 992a]MDD5970036.1 glutamate-1-semialdehyde 2,1-aminomutase [Anaerostipes sp.]OLR62667.1 glutamate-1-semialdehyde-2,1-aminomutase [Anaerostipes sp. 992a]